MAQIWVEVEESPNCAYSPAQTFEAKGNVAEADALLVPGVIGHRGPHVAVGWSSDSGGTPCPIQYVLVGDSGAGVSLLVKGGDYGIRLRPIGSDPEWRTDAPGQWGEPYMLLDPESRVQAIER